MLDALTAAEWREMGIEPEGATEGGPAYAPQALAAIWVYGFMSRVRSCRRLEVACQEQVPLMWLSGLQRPDHNTLWRFYQAHRTGMRGLFRRTIQVAVKGGLVNLALQAVDGTKIAGNAAKDRTYNAEQLERLLTRTNEAIAELEAQNSGEDEPPPPTLPAELARQQALSERVRDALEAVRAGEKRHINLHDTDVALMKGPQGFIAGYNAQVMVSAVASGGHSSLLITAAEVTAQPDDHRQLLPMIEQARSHVGAAADTTLADGGYHSGPNLKHCHEQHITVALPEGHVRREGGPYARQAFTYTAATDTYRCPEGQHLAFVRLLRRRNEPARRLYRAAAGVCQQCPAYDACARRSRHGRGLEAGPNEEHLLRHRAWMASPEAKATYRWRKMLVEPAFGLLKEQLGMRRFHLRGLANVRAEWTLLATAFNLLTLWRAWKRGFRPLGVPALT
jgi:transposase